MIIDTSTITSKVLKDLMEWETQLLKQRRYIDEKINEIERVIKENYGGDDDGEFYHPNFLQDKYEREVKS